MITDSTRYNFKSKLEEAEVKPHGTKQNLPSQSLRQLTSF